MTSEASDGLPARLAATPTERSAPAALRCAHGRGGGLARQAWSRPLAALTRQL